VKQGLESPKKKKTHFTSWLCQGGRQTDKSRGGRGWCHRQLYGLIGRSHRSLQAKANSKAKPGLGGLHGRQSRRKSIIPKKRFLRRMNGSPQSTSTCISGGGIPGLPGGGVRGSTRRRRVIRLPMLLEGNQPQLEGGGTIFP